MTKIIPARTVAHRDKSMKSLHIRVPEYWIRRLKVEAARRETTMTAIIKEAVDREMGEYYGEDETGAESIGSGGHLDL